MLKLAVAGAIAAAAAVVAFMCFAIALFLWMQQTYGALEAWLAIGALFAALALAGLIAILVLRGRRHRPRAKRAVAERAAARSEDPGMVAKLLQEPAVLLTGLQLLRFVGVRRLVPLLILGAVAGGFMLNRNGHSAHHAAAEPPSGEMSDS
jgi:hypothetical protein